MNAASRVTLFVLAGTLAGLLTWALIDLLHLIPISNTLRELSPNQARNYQFAGMAWGALLGVALGVADNLAQGQRDWLKVVGIGLGVGLVAGVVGLNFGMVVFGSLYSYPARNPVQFLGNVLARGLGWAFIGAFAGCADGIRKLSFRVGRNGFLGGLFGGILGGTTFEIVPYLLVGTNPGPTARFLGFTITGAMIGLFIALVQQLLKEAWVRVLLGRNEGKEILLEKAESRIGRSELSEIALFGDPSVQKTHAVIAAQPGGGWLLRDVSNGAGVSLNGARLTETETRLRSGDEIQVGGKLLVFYEKAVKEYTARTDRDAKRQGANAPAQPGVSPYSVAPSSAPRPGSAPRPPVMGEFRGAIDALAVVAGPHAGQRFPLTPGAIVGRDPNVALPLPADTRASRSHARFLPGSGGGWILEDLGSTNGTFVNGQRVAQVALAPGDAIVIGSTTLRLE